MSKHLLKCLKCGEYTLKDTCKCGGKAVSPKPVNFSPEDPYTKYKRESKVEEYKKRDLI